MAGLNENDVLRISIHGTLHNQQIVTSFGYKVVVPSTEPNTVTACTTLAGQWKAGAVSPFLSFLACVPVAYNADRVTVQRIAPTRNVAGVNNVNLPGTNASVSESVNQSASITTGTDLSGRRWQGGIRIPGLAQGNMENGFVTNAFLALMSTLGSKMLNEFLDTVDGTTTIYPVLLHRVPGTQIWQGNAITRTIPQRTARVMRRRTVGIGK